MSRIIIAHSQHGPVKSKILIPIVSQVKFVVPLHYRYHSTQKVVKNAICLPNQLPIPLSRQIFQSIATKVINTPVQTHISSFATLTDSEKSWSGGSGSLKKPPLAKNVLVVGSGGLSIGQAGEFDYSGEI